MKCVTRNLVNHLSPINCNKKANLNKLEIINKFEKKKTTLNVFQLVEALNNGVFSIL